MAIARTTAEFRIRFKSGNHYSLVRRKYVTETEIFAFVGGLLGLFLGVSVISLIEVASAIARLIFQKMLIRVAFVAFEIFRYNSSKQPKICKRDEKSAAVSYFNSYLKNSSIHSFFYVANASSSISKLFWLLVFTLSMTGCVFMTKNLFKKLNFSSITLIIKDQAVDVSEIPFPAITIFGKYPNPLWLLGRYPDIVTNPNLFRVIFDQKNQPKFLMG